MSEIVTNATLTETLLADRMGESQRNVTQPMSGTDGRSAGTPETSTEAAFEFGAHSPCIGVCLLDPVSGICTGCARTGTEVAEWPTASTSEKRTIWGALPERMSRLGSTKRLLPWSPTGILEFAANSFEPDSADGTRQSDCDTAGVWFFGQGRELTVFHCQDADTVALDREAGQLAVSRGPGSFNLKSHEKLRAFAYGTSSTPEIIVLTLPKGRVQIPTLETISQTQSDDGSRTIAFSLGKDGIGHALCLIDPGEGDAVKNLDTDAFVARADGPFQYAILMSETQCARIVRPFQTAIDRHDGLAATASNALDLSQLDIPKWAAVVGAFVAQPNAQR